MSLEWLKARSKENLVFFFSSELRMVQRTGHRPPVNPGELKRLLRDGLIIKNNDQRPRTFALTRYTKQVLEDMEYCQKMTAKTARKGIENSPNRLPLPHGENRVYSIKERKEEW